ncbi:hypothetical protein ACTXT7_000481 [Hymenolepis weldensis]
MTKQKSPKFGGESEEEMKAERKTKCLNRMDEKRCETQEAELSQQSTDELRPIMDVWPRRFRPILVNSVEVYQERYAKRLNPARGRSIFGLFAVSQI